MLYEGEGFDYGRHACDAVHGLQFAVQFFFVSDRAVPVGHYEVRPEAEDFFAPHVVEAGHDGKHDDENGDAEEDSDDGDKGDD